MKRVLLLLFFISNFDCESNKLIVNYTSLSIGRLELVKLSMANYACAGDLCLVLLSVLSICFFLYFLVTLV